VFSTLEVYYENALPKFTFDIDINTDIDKGCKKFVAWWRVGLAFDRSLVRFPAVPLPSSDSGQVVHTHVPLSPSSIIWYRLKNPGR